MWNGSGAWGGIGMWGTGFGMDWLAVNPEAAQAWLQLRTAHHVALQAWYDTYRSDLTTPEAQQALHDLWTTFWNDMKSFYEQYGDGAAWVCPVDDMWGDWDMGGMMGGHDWDATHMWGTGHGAAWMTTHPEALGKWLAMRGRQIEDATAWWQHHEAHPGSPAAMADLRTMRAQHRSQIARYYTRHHLPVTGSRMRDGAGGWMGLGGMWGGWGW